MKNLDDAKGLQQRNSLRVYRHTKRIYNSSTIKTPFQLVFSKKLIIPVEIGLPSFKMTHCDQRVNEDLLRVNFDLIGEVLDEVLTKEGSHKRKMSKYYNKKVRNRQFRIKDLVLYRVEPTSHIPRNLIQYGKVHSRLPKLLLLEPIGQKIQMANQFHILGILIT